ncbi:restriction endonuclease subunit S [Bacillus sp. 3P20]|uniref:restriction endonuclease subunit S n=1 Tax=Bacillus sp. 3P20 TaxID=3079309 RepID=UPI0039B43450
MTRKMKDSGIKWIGEIPKEWKVTKIGNVKDRLHHYPIGDGDHGSIKPHDYHSKGVPYIRVQNLSWGKNINFNNMVYISNDVHSKNKKSVLLPGDILIAKTGATYGKTAIIPESIEEANTTSSVGKLTVDKIKFDNNFIYYALKSDSTYTEMTITASQKSAQPGFNIEDLVEFKIPIPPKEEQERIANFLDKQTYVIDGIIEDTKLSIQELNQYKQSLITETVIKGLDKNVVMKDSGIEWIGETPENWKVIKIKHLLLESSDKSINGNEEPLSMSQKVGIIPSKLMDKIPNPPSSYVGNKLVRKGALVFNKLKAHLGVFSVSNYDGIVSPDYAVYYSKKGVNAKFLELLFKTPQCITEFQRNSRGVGKGLTRLYTYEFFNIKVSLPNLNTQNEIVAFINDKVNHINDLIVEKEQLISEFESYKKSLIYEYVTGKKEVM